MRADLWSFVAGSVVTSAIPVSWLLRNRGPRRERHREGKSDGLLLLFSLLFSTFSLWLGVVTVVRGMREAHEASVGAPVRAEVGSCTVQQQRLAVRGGGRSYELACTVFERSASGEQRRREVRAGYPARRRALDEWERTHPPGTMITLRQLPGDSSHLSGFAEQVSSATTTAGGSARQSLLFGGTGLLLFAASRALVARRFAAVRGPAS